MNKWATIRFLVGMLSMLFMSGLGVLFIVAADEGEEEDGHN